jgi:bifunctional non-homologous end joining protein LigD
MIEGARASEMPGFIKSQLATLKSKAPTGNHYDGYRLQIHLSKGKRKAYTRNDLDWTKRFFVIVGALDIRRAAP